MKTNNPNSPALAFLTLAWNSSAYPSHRQKNACMQAAFNIALAHGMRFDEDDMHHIYNRFNASYWIGCNAEGYYRTASVSGNTSACLAWEKHFQRPALLWQETAAKPERLHVGSIITWKGLNLKITSFNDAKKQFVACSYRCPEKPEGFLDHRDYRERDKPRENRVIYSHDHVGYRRILYQKNTPEGHIICHYSPPLQGEWDGKEVETRRLTIRYDELLVERKAADARARAWVKRLNAATDLPALDALAQECSAEHRSTPFRHFDLETFHATISKQRKTIEKALSEAQRHAEEKRVREQRRSLQEQHLPAWLAGEKVPISFFDITPHRLRVISDSVEVTNGNSVPISEARTALAFAQKHRRKGWQSNGKDIQVGPHILHKITPEAVIIGCTTLLWTEIDRIAPALK